mmetsp:Transcript_9482/g.13439  ORF Transcript_9482/g.13439 Transcript_9482/m.13439 type:complete len:1073 (-) Transcript_9482:82-3300(-)
MESSTAKPLRNKGTSFLPIYDVFLDIPHPAVYDLSTNRSIYGSVSLPTIIAPPEGPALEFSRGIGREVTQPRGMSNVARFSFPEFRDNNQSIPVESSQNLTKYDVYLEDFAFSTSEYVAKYEYPYTNTHGSSYHSFAMTLSSGERLYGHVRRYLPFHPKANGRFDVGRRSLRALVLLTRCQGGEGFYSAILKTLESITSQIQTIPTDLHPSQFPQKSFLHLIYTEHARLCALYAKERSEVVVSTEINQPKKARIISTSCVEFGYDHFHTVDISSYALPQSLLYANSNDDSSSATTFQILPLLRCLGVVHTLDLLSALLCERSVVLVSKSASRLSACAHASMSMLSQGLLHWPHIYVPILPPFLINYLAAPTPYLVGLMANHANVIPNIQGLSKVLVIDLDLSTLKMHGGLSASEIPDLGEKLFVDNELRTEKIISIAEHLKNDLVKVLATDKKYRSFGESAVQEKFAKGKEALKKKIGKLRLKITADRKVVPKSTDDVEEVEDGGAVDAAEATHCGEDNYSYGEGIDNEESEQEARHALTTFFITFLGNMKWYLRLPANGTMPQLDKALFVTERVKLGDVPESSMFKLLSYFKETQIFEQFVKARVDEVRLRKTLTPDSPLFLHVSYYFRLHRMDYNYIDARKIILEQFQNCNPNNYLITWNVDMRKRAMALTSNSRLEASVSTEIKRITSVCKECTYLLVNVMGVIWERLRDCRGGQWKHAVFGLQLLRDLVLQGPLSAVVEATDGLERIRPLMFYANIRKNAADQVKSMAMSLYFLLLNRSKIYSLRRAYSLHRRIQEENIPQKQRMKVLRQHDGRPVAFTSLHQYLSPSSSLGSLVETSSLLEVKSPETQTLGGSNYANDLLALNLSVQPAQPANIVQRNSEHVLEINPSNVCDKINEAESALNNMTMASSPDTSNAIGKSHTHISSPTLSSQVNSPNFAQHPLSPSPLQSNQVAFHHSAVDQNLRSPPTASQNVPSQNPGSVLIQGGSANPSDVTLVSLQQNNANSHQYAQFQQHQYYNHPQQHQLGYNQQNFQLQQSPTNISNMPRINSNQTQGFISPDQIHPNTQN